MTPSDIDIAWLAGIVDGEGCFSVKRSIVRLSGERKGHVTARQVWLVLCNTSESMIKRAEGILLGLGITPQPVRRVWKGKKATRWQFWLHIARKHDLLRVTEGLLPHLTAKADEARIVIWFLRRACAVKIYRTTPLDRLALDSMSAIKRNGGEAPAEVKDLLREVIPSEATEGAASAAGSVERVETTRQSPNSTAAHELPASLN